MAIGRAELLTTLLRDVSRSFYLTLRVLPGGIRPQISLAYLLARTTDTVADTGLLPVSQRLDALKELGERVAGRARQPLDFGSLAAQQGSVAERKLLENVESTLALLDTLTPGDRELVRRVIGVITSGQELDLTRFGAASRERVVALRNDEELDDYTYRVAGCVGEFWTRLCRAHVIASADLDDALLLAQGIRFGKGLQLVNILRDIPSDVRQGRCYLPEDRLKEAGITQEQLIDPAQEARLRPLYTEYLDKCQGHLLAGWDYTNSLPRRQVRLRLACAWPVLLGLETVRLLRRLNMLDPNIPRKVTRATVRRILFRSVLWYPFSSAWKQLPNQVEP